MKSLCYAGVVLLLLLSASAFADQVTLNTDTTLGCFTSSSSCTPTLTSVSYNPSGSNNTVTFTGAGTGNLTTVGGALTFSLGNFSWLGEGSGVGSSENFVAKVTFSLPTGISGGQSETFSADIVGVSQSGPDQLTVNFNHNSGSPIVLTFNNGTASGSFNLYVDDITLSSINDGECGPVNSDWYAHITGASQTNNTVPEPGSLTLLATGLLGMAGAMRRKLGR